MSLVDLTQEFKDDFAPIPSGTYPAFVEKAEWKTSKAGAEYLNVMFKIFGDKYENRVLFHTYNLFHTKDQVKNIAMADLKKLMLASGYNEDALKFASKEDLIEKVLVARVQVKVSVKTSTEYGEQNVVKGYVALLGEGAHDTPAF